MQTPAEQNVCPKGFLLSMEKNWFDPPNMPLVGPLKPELKTTCSSGDELPSEELLDKWQETVIRDLFKEHNLQENQCIRHYIDPNNQKDKLSKLRTWFTKCSNIQKSHKGSKIFKRFQLGPILANNT